MGNIIVIMIIGFLCFFAMKSIINDRRKGKSSCGGSCTSCGSASLCHLDLKAQYYADKKQELQSK